MIERLLQLQDEYASAMACEYQLRLAMVRHPRYSDLALAYRETVGAMEAILSELRTETRLALDQFDRKDAA